ncbi:N-acetyltransferase B complex non catalytic subunit-domain-containing protein [Pilobolus umbonatus]|nr:N-acetyltransferase B complex non catalytic subunit-domain-containing protein [Pilobolus umbonatus]
MVLDYATEKKLRPLYEALDEGQNKIALQYTAKLLKKNPDWPLVKALKALALTRSGKEEEATELCQQIKKVIPTDDATLQATTMALKELGKHSIIVEFYEAAANSQPKNEEFANHWFMAMVRNNDFKGQQAAAVKLHRQFKQNKYLFWAIMSLALQGQNGNKLSYVLAERMMAKALEEKKLEEVEQLRLYLLILLDQKKSKEALSLLLDTPLGHTALRDPEVRQIKSELLRDNKRWSDVIVMSKEALEKENADDWFNWLAYFDAVDAMMNEDGKSDALKNAELLVDDMKNAVLQSKDLKRGPFLAELELSHRLHKIGKRDKSVLLGHVVSYFKRFGAKNCCYEDIQSYILFLRSDPQASKEFIQSLRSTIESSQHVSSQTKNVQKSANIRKVEYLLNLYPCDTQSTLAIIHDLWLEYQEALPLGNDLEKTEMQYGDDFVILSAQLLVDLYNQYKQPSHLIQAASLLEIALGNSIHNFQIKLILVRIYAMLGVSKRPFEIFSTMEIKQIQLDTMIHYFTDRFISLCSSSELENMLHSSLSIYKSNEVETPEMLVKAYQYGTYSKIQEFIEFRRRLDSSLQHDITKVELMRLSSMRSSFMVKYAIQFFQERSMSELHYDEPSVSSRSDNRDFKVMINCNPEDQPSFESTCKPTKSTNSKWVQLLSYILNILSIICETKEVRNLSSVSTQFEQCLNESDMRSQVTGSEYFMGCYLSKLTQALLSIKEKKQEVAIEKLKDAIKLLQEHDTHLIVFTDSNIGWSNFHRVSISLETFNYGSVIIEMINRSLGLNSKDARRRAVEKAKTDPLMAAFLELQAETKKSLEKVQSVCKSAKEMFRPQFQKKICKQILDSDSVLACLRVKDIQNMFNNHVRVMVQSWNQSISEILEETDSRIQKLQQ